ncbi:MAG: hypothetical protein IIW47_03740 [Bacteroidales bacterium]|nr:hypothetical protein [Bacteroidales bacterium]
MEENHKRIIRNSAYMYIRMVFIMVISLYTSRVVLEILGESDFGIYTLVGGIVSIFTVLSGSLNGSVQRFLNIGLGEGNMEKTKGYFAQALSIFTVIFLLFLGVGESAGVWFVDTQLNIPAGRETATFWVYQFSLAAVLFAILQITFSGTVIARERMGIFALLGILDVTARLVVVIIMQKFGTPDNLIWYAAIIAVIQILQTLSYMVYALAKFPECVVRFQWNRGLVKEMLSFMGLSFWGNSMVTVSQQGINVLLNLFGGAVLNAASGVARQVNVAVIRLVDCINTPIKPQIVKSYAAGDTGQMLLLFEKNTKYSVMFMTILLFPLVLEAEFILDLWLKDVPPHAVQFTQIVLLESFFAVFSYSMATVVSATGKLMRMEVLGRFITLAVLPVAYLVLKAGGAPVWALVISLAAQILYVLYLFCDLRSKISLDMGSYFRNVLRPVLVLVSSLAVCTIPQVIFVQEGVARFFAVGFTTVIVGVAVIWMACLDASEREFVIRMLKK